MNRRILLCGLTFLLGIDVPASGQHAVLYPTEVVEVLPTPQGVAVADMNGDSIPDLVAPGWQQDRVTIRLADCPGVYPGGDPYPGSLAVGDEPAAVAVADFDGDLVADVATANNGSQDVTVVLRTASGGVKSTTHYAVGGVTLRFIEVAAMNGDVHPDLVTGGPNGDKVAVLLNDGTGSFGVPAVTSMPLGLVDMAVGDLNGDGAADVLTSHNIWIFGVEEIAVTLNDGFGALGSPTSLLLPGPLAVEIGQVNGDPHADLLVATTSGGLAFFSGDGSGFFGPFAYSALPGVAIDLQYEDVTGDGIGDVVTADPGSGLLRISPGLGFGLFGTPQEIPAGPDTSRVAIVDIDLDGDTDLVTANASSNTIGLLRAAASGLLRTPRRLDVQGNGNGQGALCAGLLDGDPDIDLVVVEGSEITPFLGDGAGNYLAQPATPSPAEPYAAALDRLDQGTSLDLAATFPYLNQVGVLLGDGQGGLATATMHAVGAEPRRMVLADFDEDDEVDIATANDVGWSCSILINDHAGGGFAPSTDYPLGDRPTALAAGDLNGDNHVDLVVGREQNGDLALLFGTGTGSLAPPVSLAPLSPGATYRGLLTLDLDQDGLLDIVFQTYGEFGVMLGLGAGQFALAGEPIKVVDGEVTELRAADDLNGDGHPDLVGISAQRSTVVVLLGDGAGGFAEIVRHSAAAVGSPTGHSSIVVEDLDGDGEAFDLATLSRVEDGVNLLLHDDPGGPWAGLGNSLGGSTPAPRLIGTGSLEAGSWLGLCLHQARSSAVTFLFVGDSRIDAPFRGGTLVPLPDTIYGPFVTDANGSLRLLDTFPSGVQPNTTLFFQHWIVDPNAPFGLAASNAISGTVP